MKSPQNPPPTPLRLSSSQDQELDNIELSKHLKQLSMFFSQLNQKQTVQLLDEEYFSTTQENEIVLNERLYNDLIQSRRSDLEEGETNEQPTTTGTLEELIQDLRQKIKTSDWLQEQPLPSDAKSLWDSPEQKVLE